VAVESDDELMTLAVLASMLKIPRQTLYSWRTRGDGPPGIKLGKHIRYRRRDVEEWLDARTEARPR
jgi:excisionase family DNA binding protein